MRPRQKKKRHIIKQGGWNLFCYLTLLTLLFVTLEIGVVLQFSGFYLGDFKGVASHLAIPIAVWPPVLFFLLVHFFIHLLFILIIWVQAIFIGSVFKLSEKKIETLGIVLWVFTLITLLIANQFYFPNSKFAGLMELIFSHDLAGIISYLLMSAFVMISLVALWGVAKQFPLASKLMLFTTGMLIITFKVYYRTPTKTQDASSDERPNIIIIGLDAVRPDFLGYFGYEKITPHLDSFFNESTVFAQSLTPLARTFPAWVSILTGQYPKFHGARTDLEDPQDILSLHVTLPELLRHHGYTTVFATDDTRFSNVDQKFGFDQVVTPPIGFNDFLLGSFNDFPLSNFLVNTRLGQWLFPYSYGNRSAYSTYNPDSFLALIKPALEESRSKPLFLAVHICLAHFPYSWGNVPSSLSGLAAYQAALHRVDQQFDDLVGMLRKNNILQHAIVIVLSDHGEALELHGDRATQSDLFISADANQKNVVPVFYPPNRDSEEVDQSAGHGTDVLGLTQYHNLLAFRLFGLKANQHKAIADRVSLLDIKPTLLDLLRIAAQEGNGSSLATLIMGQNTKTLLPKHFFTESDYSPISIHTVHPETRDVLFEGINFFQIDPLTTRISVKESMKKLIFSSKQYADFYGEWVLALYPQSNKTMQPILVNLKTGKWTNNLQTSFAMRSPANDMLKAMKQFYGSEISKTTP